jgi:outer membrane protein assembly factor BamA
MRSRVLAGALLALAFSTACKEEGSVKVHRLTFKGVKEVDEGRLKTALSTRQSSIIPWGRKYYFDRSRFDADLKRIQAFYADRGYPDARVVGFDVKLNN